MAVAYRRDVFDAVGTFDEAFDACEDVEFNHRVARAGLRCFFTPRACASATSRAATLGLFRQMARYGRGRVRLLRKHPETFSLPGFVPALFVAGVLLGPLLGVLVPELFLAYFAVFGVYARLSWASGRRCAAPAPPRAAAAAPRRIPGDSLRRRRGRVVESLSVARNRFPRRRQSRSRRGAV